MTLNEIADQQRFARCPECERVFDLMDEDDANEFFYGHDCEAPPTIDEPEFVGLDLDANDELTNWTVSFAVRNSRGIAWISEVTVYACEDTVEECAREDINQEYGVDGEPCSIILVDFTRHNPEKP